MPAVFRENRAGIEEMLRQPWIVAELRRRAEEGKRRAEEIAPVRTGRYKTGHVVLAEHNDPGGHRRAEQGANFQRFEDGGGFHVEVFEPGADGRPWARLSNDTPYAYFLEHGTRYMAKQRILGRAIDSMSGRG